MLTKVKNSFQKLVESFTACGFMMVQGDLSVFTFKHFVTAAEVGILTAVAYFITLSLHFKIRYAPIWLAGVFTALADWVVHPPMIPFESLLTGVCAMIIASIFEILRSRNG